MPFTLSHPLAAAVFRRTPLPLAATVAGTMSPDLPLFLPHTTDYAFTHSLLGVVTPDLAIGLAGLAGWVWLLRDALVDTAPSVVRDRFAVRARYSGREWTLAPIAVVVGSITHVGWDSFTHEGRWGVRHVSWLRDQYFGNAGYHWAQAISSVVGLAAVVGWTAVFIGRRPRRARRACVPHLAVIAPVAVAVITVVATAIGAQPYLFGDLHDAAFAGAVRGVTALGVALLAAAAVWQVAARQTEASELR